MLLPLLAATALFQGPSTGLTARVNDPASHGSLGDQLLSLDEAIRLANGTLMPMQLSAAEQARLVGQGPMVDRIEIDAMTTPVITLTAPLTEVTGMAMPAMPMRLVIASAAMAMPGMGLPVLQGQNQPRILALRSHEVTVEGLRFQGGQVAVDAQMAMAMGGPMHAMAAVMGCEFAGQTTAGVRLWGTGADESMLMVMHSTFSGLPVGLLVDDQTATGRLMAEFEHVAMDQVALGCDAAVSGTGMMTELMFFRCHFDQGATFARSRRVGTSSRQFMFRIVHCDVHCTGDVLDVQGNTTGLTMVHHHHSDFLAGPGRKAFWIHPRTAEFDVHGSEMVFAGDVVVAGNTLSPRFWLQNNVYRGGTVTYDVDGALPNLLWNVYEQCQLVVPSTARTPVVVRQSELRGGSVAGNSLFAGIELRGCYQNGAAQQGNVTVTQAAPQPFLGTTTVGPADPALGSTLQVAADLPFGIAGVWDFAIAYRRPTTTAEPVRFYADPATVVVMPGLLVFQSTVNVPIPNLPGLLGIEFYAQAVTVPLFAQPYAPAFHLPRGTRFVPRL